MVVNIIDKNLLRLTYRSELTEMFFEFINYIKNKKALEISKKSKEIDNHFGLGS